MEQQPLERLRAVNFSCTRALTANLNYNTTSETALTEEVVGEGNDAPGATLRSQVGGQGRAGCTASPGSAPGTLQHGAGDTSDKKHRAPPDTGQATRQRKAFKKRFLSLQLSFTLQHHRT